MSKSDGVGNEYVSAVFKGDDVGGGGSALNCEPNLSNDKLNNNLSNNFVVFKGDDVGGGGSSLDCESILSNDKLDNILCNNSRLTLNTNNVKPLASILPFVPSLKTLFVSNSTFHVNHFDHESLVSKQTKVSSKREKGKTTDNNTIQIKLKPIINTLSNLANKLSNPANNKRTNNNNTNNNKDILSNNNNKLTNNNNTNNNENILSNKNNTNNNKDILSNDNHTNNNKVLPEHKILVLRDNLDNNIFTSNKLTLKVLSNNNNTNNNKVSY